MENTRQPEPFKIEIEFSKDGQIKMTPFALTEDSPLPSVPEIIGLLEIVKSQMLSSQNAPQAPEMIDVELTEADFLSPYGGELKKEGKRVGDTIKMPKPMIEIRDQMLKELVDNTTTKA